MWDVDGNQGAGTRGQGAGDQAANEAGSKEQAQAWGQGVGGLALAPGCCFVVGGGVCNFKMSLQ